MKYSSIKNMEQLKSAQLEVKYKIEAKERQIAQNYAAIKAYFNPLTYINRIVTKLYSLRFVGKYVAMAYDYIKELVSKWRNSRKENGVEAPKEAVAVEEPQGAEPQA